MTAISFSNCLYKAFIDAIRDTQNAPTPTSLICIELTLWEYMAINYSNPHRLVTLLKIYAFSDTIKFVCFKYGIFDNESTYQ